MRRQRVRKALILVSFLLFPITLNYFSPVVIIGGTATGVISGSFIMFGLQFASSLALGRGFSLRVGARRAARPAEAAGE